MFKSCIDNDWVLVSRRVSFLRTQHRYLPFQIGRNRSFWRHIVKVHRSRRSFYNTVAAYWQARVVVYYQV